MTPYWPVAGVVFGVMHEENVIQLKMIDCGCLETAFNSMICALITKKAF